MKPEFVSLIFKCKDCEFEVLDSNIWMLKVHEPINSIPFEYKTTLIKLKFASGNL